MSLLEGPISAKNAAAMLENNGPEYLRGLLQSSWAKLQSNERLSSKEEAAILTVLGQHEKREENGPKKGPG